MMKILLWNLLALGIFTSSMAGEHHHHGHHKTGSEQSQAPMVTDSLYNTKIHFLNSEGQSIPFSSLRGRPVVISMAYTGCNYTCPMVIAQMQNIEKRAIVKGKTDVQFVVVSFDHERDKPPILSQYAKKRSLSDRWSLLTSVSGKESRLIANLLGIKYQKTSNGEYDHSFIISVLDSEGVIKAQQIGANEDPEKLLEGLP